MKVTVVGAGNVGATCADVLAYREIANEVVVVDIKEGVAEGKALDIWQKSPITADSANSDPTLAQPQENCVPHQLPTKCIGSASG